MLQEQNVKRFLNLQEVISAHARTSRALWIQRINAAARLEDLSYSKLMGLIHKAGIEINRKVLADLAMNNPEAFKAIVEKAKNAQ